METKGNYKAELVGAFGYPIAENPTGIMQEAAFQALGINWRYLLIEVQPRYLKDAVQGVRAFQMQGINLTIPHKVEVLKYLDHVSEDARLIGAVNTVRRVEDQLIGENTDGKGFIRSLQEDAKISPQGKNALIIGAGGAARAIAVELALAGAKHVTILNRSKERGEPLAALINQKTSAQAEFIHWQSAFSIPSSVDILINATSIGLYPNINEKPNIDFNSIRSSMLVCDVIPNPPQTAFLDEAKKRNATTLDGLGMLVYQGAIALKMWTGLEAPIAVMRQALEKAFGY
jgi:shikimate dehydrogenase